MLKTSLLLTSLLVSVPALAQDAPAPDAAATVPETRDGDVIVTATRAPTELDRVAASVTVLDKAEIDRARDRAAAAHAGGEHRA